MNRVDLPYREADLDDLLESDVCAWGRTVWESGQVVQCETTPDGQIVLGRVSSVGDEAYRLTVRLRRTRNGLQVQGRCSCERGQNCKHVYALLLTALKGGPQGGGEGEQKRQKERPSPIRSLSKEQYRGAQNPAPPPSEQASGNSVLDPALERWVRELGRGAARAGRLDGGRCLNYTLIPLGSAVAVQLWSVQLRLDGAIVKPFALPRTLDTLPQYALEDLEPLDLLLGRTAELEREATHRLREGKGSEALLLRLLHTGRLFWRTPQGSPLRPGPECTGVPHWALEGAGKQRPALHLQGRAEEKLELLPGLPGLYLNAAQGELGVVRVDWPPDVLNLFLRGPVVLPEAATAVAARLEYSGRAKLSVALPSPNPIRVSSEAPHLERRLTFFSGTFEVGFRRQSPLDSVCVRLSYAGEALSGHSGSTLEQFEGAVLRRFERDYAAEKGAFVALERVGLRPLAKIFPQWKLPMLRREHWTLRGTLEEHPGLWLHFVAESLPRLRAAGWQIEFDPSFRFNFSEPEAWHATLESGEEGWFDLALGIEVEGERLDLLPILGELAQQYSLEALERLPQDEPLVHRLPDGRRLLLPLERVRPLLETLLELYSRPPAGGALRLPRLDAVRLAQLEALTELRWWGGEALLELGRKLRDFRQITAVTPSPQLRATLRPYQLEGLSWLCFLREAGLSGLLADDMGLGKTLQTLAYLQIEHRMLGAQRPSLIVAPTSVLDTWRREASHFTPDLKTVLLHGPQRTQHFESLQEYDLILTSYALVWRDLEVLERLHFHTLVLDEAQTVKNSRSRAHVALSTLQSEQRLCLSGTPLENHLGELWSLFHFLMPGLLGSAQDFKKHYRIPIERGGDVARRELLSARVRPFLLRRLKDRVAGELPPKSETRVYLPLEGTQRDLYETLRLSLSARLERTLATQGLERSHLHVLDVLLKLRQVCCAPGLVNLARNK